jgi:restriction system protein
VARRSKTILDDLALLPWWINVYLAALVYLSFKYLIPSISFQSPLYKSIARALPGLAPLFGGILLFVAGISAFNAWRNAQLLDRQTGIGTFRTMSWQEFEEIVGEAYRRKGYMVTETGGGGADGGVDLVLKRGGEKLLVQCKHWKMEKVGAKVVRERYGVVAAEGASGGVIISSGKVAQEARDFARGKPLELLDGSELLNLIAEVQKEPMPLNKKANDTICPLCGAEMVLRTAKKGPNAGEKFWGCSTFPECGSTKPYKG